MSPQPPPKKVPSAKANPGKAQEGKITAPKAALPQPGDAAPPISDDLALKPASNYMTRNPVYATPSSTIRRAIQIMLNHKISGLPVLDNGLRCVGVYSEVDAMLQASSQNIDSKIKYSSPAKFVSLETPFRDVLVFLVKNRLKRVPVVDAQKKLCGIITRRDVMEVFFNDYQKNNP